MNATGQPQFVAVPLHWAADLIAAHPVAWDVPFATVQLLFVLASGIWVLAQNFGGLYTGQATDPNTAPLIALTAVALVGAHRRRSTSTAPESAPAARSTSKISISFQGTDL